MFGDDAASAWFERVIRLQLDGRLAAERHEQLPHFVAEQRQIGGRPMQPNLLSGGGRFTFLLHISPRRREG